MNSKQTSRSKHLDFIVLDFICVELAFFVSYWIRFRDFNAFKNVDFTHGDYMFVNVIIILSHFMIVFFSECYSGILKRGLIREIKSVVAYNLELIAMVLIVLYFKKDSALYSRTVLGLFIVCNIVFVYTVRSLRKWYLCRQTVKTGKLNRMMVVTDYEHAEELVSGLKTFNYNTFYVRGLVITNRDMKGERVGDIPVVSNAGEMYDHVKRHVVDEVFIGYMPENLAEMMDKFLEMGAVVHVNVNGFVPSVPNASLGSINDYTVVSSSISLMTFKQKFIKRVIDLVACIPGLLVTGILFIILAPIIKIQSPGPVFFKQKRVGKNGRIFNIYKFRSMYTDAEERKKELMSQNKMDGLMFKIDNDPRIFPAGKIIRKLSLDEFPQFINIFLGDMSLVGTRPPTLDEYKQYEEHHKSRLAIKPGLTGMWQVSGRSDITDFEEVVRLDNKYIRNYSLSLDLKIIIRTLLAVFMRQGAE